MKIRKELAIAFFLNMLWLNSCLFIFAPRVFIRFDEREVVGPGTYEQSELKWSFDGEYLAFIDHSGEWSRLGIYELDNNKSKSLVETDKIAWHPNGQITYLVNVLNDSILTYPIHNDLYIMDTDGKNTKLLIAGLGNVTYFIWSRNGKEMFFVERENNQPGVQNIYRLNSVTGDINLFLNASELNVKAIYLMAFSPDETQLLIWTDHPCEMGRGDCVALVIYDIESKEMTSKILGSQLSSLTVEDGGVYSLNPSWLNDTWTVTRGHAILNDEPYLSLAFVNLKDTSQSFEIEAQNQFGGAILSPDLSYIAYINVNRGPHTQFITISKMPQEILDKLSQ